jgi:excisionase family DNA binding protein
MNQDEKKTLEWLGLRELTQYAAVSERTLRSWIQLPCDPLPAVRAGGKILVRRAQFDAWLERRRIEPLPEVDVNAIVRDLVTR